MQSHDYGLSKHHQKTEPVLETHVKVEIKDKGFGICQQKHFQL